MGTFGKTEAQRRALAEKVGVQIWWSLAGLTDIEALRQAWPAAGLPIEELPEAPGDAKALARATQDCYDERSCIWVQPRPDGGTLVRSEDAGDDVRHGNVLTVVWDKAAHQPKFIRREACESDKEFEDLRARVLARWEIHKVSYDTTDISKLLTGCVQRLGGTRMSRAGHIYFVAKWRAQEWWRRVDALVAVSQHAVYTNPQGNDCDMAAAIFDCLAADVDQMARDLDRDMSGGKALGATAASNRQRESAELLGKVQGFEALLEVTQPVLREKLDRIRVRAQQAELAARAARAREKAAVLAYGTPAPVQPPSPGAPSDSTPPPPEGTRTPSGPGTVAAVADALDMPY